MIVSKVLEFSAPFGRSASVLQSIRVSAASIANGDSSTTTSTTTTSSTAVTPTPDTPSTISSNGTHHTHSKVQINQEGDDTAQGTLDSTDHNCSSDSLDTGSVASSSSTAAPLPTLFFELARDEPRSLYHIIKTAITSTAFSENAGWTDQGAVARAGVQTGLVPRLTTLPAPRAPISYFDALSSTADAATSSTGRDTRIDGSSTPPNKGPEAGGT